MSDCSIDLREFGYGIVYGAAAACERHDTILLWLDTRDAHRAVKRAYDYIEDQASFQFGFDPRRCLSYDWHVFVAGMEERGLITPLATTPGRFLLNITWSMQLSARRWYFQDRWVLWEKLGKDFSLQCQ